MIIMWSRKKLLTPLTKSNQNVLNSLIVFVIDTNTV